MKTAFNIVPPDGWPLPDNLLVEVGSTGISFTWYVASTLKFEAIAVYNFDADASITEIAADLKSIIEANGSFRQGNYNTTIAFDFKESLLVPAEYFNELARVAMLDLVFGNETDVVVYSEKIGNKDLFNVYRVAKDIIDVLHQHFPSADLVHANSLLLNCNEINDGLHCIVDHNSIKVILYKNGALQIVQQFSYSSAADVSYHLLNTCIQYAVSVSETRLVLSGLIDEQSNLYSEIYKYFLHIEFSSWGNVSVDEGIQQYPQHFFSHLMSMASCVS